MDTNSKIIGSTHQSNVHFPINPKLQSALVEGSKELVALAMKDMFNFNSKTFKFSCDIPVNINMRYRVKISISKI